MHKNLYLFISNTFIKILYMFRTDLLSIIRSLDIVFTATGICHASFSDCHTSSVDFLLADSQHN